MPKDINVKNFFPYGEYEWRESGESETLHSFLQRFEIEIPSGCEFMRFKNDLIYCWINVKSNRICIKIIYYGKNTTQNEER